MRAVKPKRNDFYRIAFAFATGHWRNPAPLAPAKSARFPAQNDIGHADYTGVPRDTMMAKALVACDELCGFLTACALVQPGKTLAEVKVRR